MVQKVQEQYSDYKSGSELSVCGDYKKLTRKVKNRMDEKDAKSILITSVLENEGKSTVVANLALALAQESKKSTLN